jgi:outer membrane lipoprotein-sorting protein
VIRALAVTALAVLALAQSALGAETRAASVAETLRELGRASGAVTTMRAHFVQEKRITIVRDVLRSSGTFFLDKRGRIAWDVAEPDRLRIVITRAGIFAGGKRVTGGPDAAAGEAAGKFSPLPLLEGLNGIFAGLSPQTAKDFEVTMLDRDRLRLVPRSRELCRWVGAIELRLGGQARIPVEVRIEEPGGDVTDIRFSDVAVNPALDDSAFAP